MLPPGPRRSTSADGRSPHAAPSTQHSDTTLPNPAYQPDECDATPFRPLGPAGYCNFRCAKFFELSL